MLVVNMGLVCAQGGSEAKHSNELLHRIISEAVEAVAPEVGPGLVSLINTRDEIRDLLKLDDVIDLVRADVNHTDPCTCCSSKPRRPC